MKQVVLFIDSLGSGGAQRQIVSLAVSLKQIGYSVEVLIYDNKELFFKEELESASIKVNVVNASNKIDRITKCVSFLRRKNADCVISFLDTPNLILLIAKPFIKSKVIICERSANENMFKSIKGKIYLRLSKRAYRIVCNSNNAGRIWINANSALEKKIITIYNIYDLPLLEKVREMNKSENDRIVIVIPAHYSRVKGVMNVIKATSLLPNEMRDRIRIEWFGRKTESFDDSSLYEEASSLIKTLGLMDVVELHSETHGIYEKMWQADFVGLFSDYEGLPNSICEAMCLGKAIIMTKVSDFDVLVNGNGFCCEQGIEGISEGLLNIARSSRNQRNEMEKNSMELAKLLFDREKTMCQWTSLI